MDTYNAGKQAYKKAGYFPKHRWSDEEIKIFVELFAKHGTHFKMYEETLKRNYSQIKSFYYNQMKHNNQGFMELIKKAAKGQSSCDSNDIQYLNPHTSVRTEAKGQDGPAQQTNLRSFEFQKLRAELFPTDKKQADDSDSEHNAFFQQQWYFPSDRPK